MSKKTTSNSSRCSARAAMKKQPIRCEPDRSLSGAHRWPDWFFALTRLGILLKSLFDFFE